MDERREGDGKEEPRRLPPVWQGRIIAEYWLGSVKFTVRDFGKALAEEADRRKNDDG